MRGRPKAKSVEELLPEVWRVVDELRQLTEGLEAAIASSKEGDSRGPDDG